MISQRALDTFALCSVRYALGRQTYIVDDVLQALSEITISKQIRTVICRDIRLDIERGLVGDMDLPTWIEVLEALEA